MKKIVTVIDYGSGNVRSVLNALNRVAELSRSEEKFTFLLSDKEEDIERADRLILPGVGAFDACKAAIDARPGLRAAIDRAVLTERKPFLGICVGMQLLAGKGYENGVCDGLKYIPGEVRRFSGAGLKIPHISWAKLKILTDSHPLLKDIHSGSFVYYVHSYHFIADLMQDVGATSDYGGDFAALVIRDHIAGAQFHPEKSGETGLKLLENFLFWNP